MARKNVPGCAGIESVWNREFGERWVSATELPAFDSEGLRRSARRVCGDRGRHSPDV